MGGKNEFRRSASRSLAIACAAALSSAVVHADSTIYEYQFTADTFNPTTVASNLVGSAFEYTNANPGYPPLNNPPFIVQGGIDPDDPAYFVAQGDWYPAEDGLNENYYTFNVSVAPGFILNASSFSVFANARQAVLFDSQVAYSTSSNFSNPVNFDTTPFLIRRRMCGTRSPLRMPRSPMAPAPITFEFTVNLIPTAQARSAIC